MIKEQYKGTEDWDGKHYLDLTVRFSVPDYIPKALSRFKRDQPQV